MANQVTLILLDDVAKLGLAGDADDYLGHTFKVIYSVNNATKLISVLSAIEVSEKETFLEAVVNTSKGYVTIGGVNYSVVEEYSDILATNANEMLVYAYENDRTLTQLTTLDALNERLGLYAIDLFFYGDSETASVAILRNFQLGKLEVTFVILTVVTLITYRNSGSYKNEEGFK